MLIRKKLRSTLPEIEDSFFVKMDRDKSDIEVQVRAMESVIARDRMSLWIQRGVIVFILAMLVRLTILSELSVWRALLMLLAMLLLIGVKIVSVWKIRKLKRDKRSQEN